MYNHLIDVFVWKKRWIGRRKDVRLDTRWDSLSRNQLHLLTSHTQSYTHNIIWVHTPHTHTHQGVKHEDVVVVSLRVFHHDVEQGIQSVLQKLNTHIQTKERSGESQSTHLYKYTLAFTLLTLTTSSPSMILSFSRFSLRSSGRVLHLSSPSRPTGEERHTEHIFCLAVFNAAVLFKSGCWSTLL